jgi:hypothetical protein
MKGTETIDDFSSAGIIRIRFNGCNLSLSAPLFYGAKIEFNFKP